ncbi:MAG: geranylgeranyl reductase family protein [Caldithrix sp.]|nr:geranylgeranyl reductase family protein [Caldithrix sp.]
MTENQYYTDVAIVGAGPAGSSTSIFLSKAGIKHSIFDQAAFPRDKVCGDGLSGKVVSYLNQMDKDFVKEMDEEQSFSLDSWGVRFVSPGGYRMDIPYVNHAESLNHPPGFVVRRSNFDHFLVSKLDPKYAEAHFNHKLINLQRADKGLELTFRNGSQLLSVKTKMVVGAEGDRSMVAKKLANFTMGDNHYLAGLRVYYHNIDKMLLGNYIELHFHKQTLPGYFWIFPLSDGYANVGIAMLSRHIKKRGINLKKLLNDLLQQNDDLRYRFRNAQAVSKISGWRLPLGSRKRKISGERFVLTGDAGSLIDPFTGEGIGNAMLSAKAASEMIQQAVIKNDFSASLLAGYDQKVYEHLWDELRVSKAIQKLVQFPWLFNWVIKRVSKRPQLQKTFSSMFNDIDLRAKLKSPAFYLHLLKS